MRGIIGLLVQAAGEAQLARHREDGPFVVRLERRILAAPDRVHDRAGDAVFARSAVLGALQVVSPERRRLGCREGQERG